MTKPDYGPGFPEDCLLLRTVDGYLETRLRLVGVERVIRRQKQDGGFSIGGRQNEAEIIKLRRKRSDLGAHYAMIWQRSPQTEAARA